MGAASGDSAQIGLAHRAVAHMKSVGDERSYDWFASARTPETGDAGRFVVFGHGRCFGADGHRDPTITAASSAGVGPAGGRHPLMGRMLLRIYR